MYIEGGGMAERIGNGRQRGEVVVIGGAVCGLSVAMLLAKDGWRVRVLERDPAAPPADPDGCWESWDRRGVGQFRLLHSYLPRWRQEVEAELPEVAAAMDGAGALRTNSIASAPEQLTGGPRPDDGRYEVLTARRPVMESVLARVASTMPGVAIERGVAVTGLLVADHPALPGVPHVAGVATDDGRRLAADLVVDAGGRRSPLPRWLAEVGARPPAEAREDSGFRYYSRHFRSPDGSVPPMFGPPLQPYDSVSLATLPTDNGTWGIAIVTSMADDALRPARRPEVWSRILAGYPLAAHWLDGEPISDVDVFSRIEDRHRRYWVDGAPVATGVVAVGDAWACTNPSVGRGVSIGLLHALALRDVLREVDVGDAVGLARQWDEATLATVEPLFRDTLSFDRHRLAEIDAQIAGVPYETDDPAWHRQEALRRGAATDPDLLRGYAAVRCLLDRPCEVWAQPGIAAKAATVGDPPPAPGPSRRELLALVGA
jgi:2-polyprenyl-6-methoxyphenol hydroxylase-like FAD-dependent oxidoreductase